MKQMQLKRLLVMCLAVMLSVSMLPAGVFAVGENGQDNAVVNELGNNGEAGTPENGQPGNDDQLGGGDNDVTDGDDDIIDGDNDTDDRKDGQSDDVDKKDTPTAPSTGGDENDTSVVEGNEEDAVPDAAGAKAGGGDSAAYVTIFRSINGATRREYEDGEVLSIASFYDLELELKGQFENKNQKKVIEIEIPTGWQLKEIDAMETTPPQSGLTFGRYSKDEYKLKNVDILPVSYEGNLDTPYGIVSGSTWPGQRLDEFLDNGSKPARTYGAKLVYTYENNAQAFDLKLRLSPQQELLSHIDSSVETMPDLIIKQINGSTENEKPIHAQATNVPVVNVHSTEASYEVPISEGKTPLTIGFSTSNYNGTANNHSSGSYYDTYEYTITFPEGVFLNKMERLWYTNYKDYDQYTVTNLYEDHPEKGGGTITVTGKFGYTRHSSTYVNDIMRGLFYANTGGYEGCDKVWKDGDVVPFSVSGHFTRNNKQNDFAFSWKRTLYDGSGGEAYKIRINSTSRTRRDITQAYNTDKDFFLAKAPLVVTRSYDGVKFYMENENDNLNITCLCIPGYNIRDLVVKTRNGETLTIPNQSSAAATKYTSTQIDLKSYGLKDGDYFSSCTFVIGVNNKLGEYGNSTSYFRGGFAFAGKFRQDVQTDAEKAGQVNIYALNKDTTEFTKTEDGDLVDKDGKSVVAVRPADPETGVAEPIKGYARVTPGIGKFGMGMVTNYVNNKKIDDPTKWGNHKGYYPNERLYYGSSYQVATEFTEKTENKESTLIDPVITVSLPAGLELDLSTVQLYSAGGNRGAGWFNARFLDKRTIDINGVEWNCYDFTSPEKFDVVVPELRAGGTAYFRFEAVVSPTCPRYELNTNTCILWSPGDVFDTYGSVGARDSAGTNYEDGRNRMGKNTDQKKYHYMSNSVAYYVYPIIGLNLDLAISTEENPDKWFTYAGIESTIATVQEDKIANVKLSYESTSESDFYKNTYIYLPIPKTGQSNMYLNNTILGAPDPTEMADKTETPKFSMDLTGPVTMTSENGNCRWETEYAISTTPNDVLFDEVSEADKDKWEPVKDTQWVTEDQITDWSKVVMLRFRSKDEIAPGEKGSAVLSLKVDKNAEFDELDYWRGYGKASLGANTNNWRSTSIVAATPSSATFLGQMFVDSDLDAAFDKTKGDKEYKDQKYSATLEHLNDEGSTIHAYAVEVGDDGSLKVDNDGYPQYLHKGDYRLIVTRADDEEAYVYEKIESDTASSEGHWYNDIKNANISDKKAVRTFTIDKSVIDATKRRAAGKAGETGSTVKPAVYYTGVGLAKLNDFSFTKLGEVEGNDGSVTNEPLAGAKFAVYTDSACTTPAERDGTAYEATSGSDGKVEFKDIVAGTYYMKETELPSGSENTYFANKTTYKVVVSNDENAEITRTVADPNTGDTTGSQDDGYSIINRQKTSVSGIKIWNDGGANEHPSIVVDVIAEGADEAARTVEVIFSGEPEEGQVLATRNDDGSWSFTIGELRKFNNGANITYNIVEQALEGYITTSDGNTITNTKTTEATVKKVWNDGNNAARKRPSTLEFGLYQSVNGGNAVAVKGKDNKDVTVTLPVEGKWEKTIKDLPKYDANKDEITYSWKELSDLDNYKQSEPSVSGTVTTFTNTLLKQITVKKKWEVPDSKTTPDSVKVYLKGGSVEYSAELSENNEWKHTFGNTDAEILLAYDEQGNEIEYTVTEDEVANYSTEVGEPVVAEDKSVTITVTNTYEATGTLTLGGLKKLSVPSGKLVEGQFTFTVTDNGNEIATGTNDSEGNITFTPATVTYNYDKDNDDTGDHELVISETGEDGNGAKADAEDVKVTVTVSDNGDKTLAVSPDDITDSVVMTNTYETSGEITLSGKKILNGDTLSAGQFSFELYDEDGDLVESVSNDADGNYSFGTLKFTGDDLDKDADGNFTETTKEYKIVEEIGTDSEITYDETEYIVTVTLVDDGHGCINVTADPEEDSFDFINEYTPEKDKPGKGTKTGDDNHLMGWIALLLIAGAGGGVIAYRRRRRSN